MARRLLAASLVAAGLFTATVGAYADDPPAVELPRADCKKSVTDDPGDAAVDYSPAAGTQVQPAASVDALDITSVTVRVTATQVGVYLKLKDIPATMGQYQSAYYYYVRLQIDGAPFVFKHKLANAAFQGKVPTDTTAYPIAFKDPGGSAELNLANVTGSIDANDSNYVIITAPRSELERVLKRKLVDGEDVLDHISATTQEYSVKAYPADSLDAADANPTFTVGDDYCFGPPPASLTDLDPTTVQYGDPVTVGATLQTEDGSAAIEGKTLTFTAGPMAPKSATTDADGYAEVTFTPPATLVAATYPVTVSFTGDATNGKVKGTTSLIVALEVTKFAPLKVAKPSSTSRVVTATLLDDDGHVVPSQPIDFYVGGKKVATVKADSGGKAVFKGAKPGQTVQAKLVTVGGKYKSAASTAVKV